MSIVQSAEFTLTGAGEPARIQVAIVAAEIFNVLGIAPLVGRSFTRAEERQGAAGGLNGIVLSFECWQRRFVGKRDLVGSPITLDDQAYQVIGVMPGGIFPLQQEPIEGWITTAYGGAANQPDTMNGSRGYRAYIAVLARLRADVTLAQAQAEMDNFARHLAEKYPANNKDRVTHVYALRDLLTEPAKPLLWLLLGIVGLVLLIACANVANLLLARATTRQREMVIRAALGASRWQMARQLLIESLLLSLLSGVIGILIALWGVDLLLWFLPADIPRIAGLTPDVRVIAFTLAASILTGLLCGLAPALSAARTALSAVVKEGGRGVTSSPKQRFFRNALVAGQIAVALTLLVGAGLLLRSFVKLNQVDPGFRSDNLLTAEVALSAERYAKDTDQLAFYEALTARLQRLPGVTHVSLAQSLPLTSEDNGTNMEIVGQPFPRGQEEEARLRFIGLNYFETLGIPSVAGRAFAATDNQQAPRVALINEAFARRYFAGQNPLRQKLKLGWGGDEPKEIVGVFGNVRHRGLNDEARPEMYVPLAQFPTGGMRLLVRTQVPPETLSKTLVNAVHELDAQLPVTKLKTLAQYRSNTLALPRFNLFVLLTFAGLALTLSLIGLYGVMSYAVAQRTREFGLRLALGAQPPDILQLVLKQGLTVVGIGLAIGIALALVLTRVMQSLLFGVTATDPLTFIGVAVLLVAVALLSCWFPARRATKVDPMIALRCE
jgi:putative ABC transport system permease protein